MRYVVIGFCVFAAACAGAAPTGPTPPLSQIDGRIAAAQAKGGSALALKGTYEGLEKVDPTTPSQHSLVDATGNATHLGRFTVTAKWTIAPTGNFGTSLGTRRSHSAGPLFHRVS